MISAIRILEFDAGHRVVGHESKCRTLHGHRYAAHFYCRSAPGNGLDQVGRVIDFSVIKEIVGSWLDSQWDHTMLLWKEDPDLNKIKNCSGFKNPYICDFNPTAENLAWFLLKNICPSLLKDTGVEVHKILLYETPNCMVEAST